MRGNVVPLEVKSGKDYKRHNALINVINSPDYPTEEGFVLCEKNVERHGNVTYLPIYMTSCFSLLADPSN
jgi:hypothetical protein